MSKSSITQNDVIDSINSGGSLAGMSEKAWLQELSLDLEDWFLRDTECLRDVYQFLLNSDKYREDMVDRIDHFVDDVG